LGNCYFLSAISAIAEKPERIKRIFINKEANSLGIYGLRICECGEFREIIIDDYIPFNP
jgi:calpain-15